MTLAAAIEVEPPYEPRAKCVSPRVWQSGNAWSRGRTNEPDKHARLHMQMNVASLGPEGSLTVSRGGPTQAGGIRDPNLE